MNHLLILRRNELKNIVVVHEVIKEGSFVFGDFFESIGFVLFPHSPLLLESEGSRGCCWHLSI
jgi:hypothetical protein